MKSIRSKILLSVILLTAVSLSIVGGVSAYLNYSSTYSTLSQTMSETAHIAAERVQYELASYTNIVKEIGHLSDLSAKYVTTGEKRAVIDERVKAYGFQQGDILDAGGKSVFSGTDYSAYGFFQNSMNGDCFISRPSINPATGELTFFISAPLWANGVHNSTVAGVVYFVPDGSILQNIISSIRVGESGAAYIIDADGVTIADIDIEQVKRQENVEEVSQTDPSLRKLATIHAKMRQGESGFDTYSYGGIDKFISYAPIPTTSGWSVAVTSYREDFMQETIISVLLTIGMILIAIVVSVIVALNMARQIADPVKQCSQRLALLAQGDLDSPVPDIQARDETGILASATRTTVVGLKDIIRAMEEQLGAVAEGNLTREISGDISFPGNFQALRNAMEQINVGLNMTLASISQASDQVSGGAEQVSAGAQALSQGDRKSVV